MPIWAGAPKFYMRKAQAIINKAARFITGLERKTKTKTLMAECNWMEVQDMADLYAIVALWKVCEKTSTWTHGQNTETR